MSEKNPYQCPPLFGHDMWKWPEFQAFARRLGLPVDFAVTGFRINVPAVDELVTIDVYLRAADRGVAADRPAVAETTTLNNDKCRTHAPRPQC